MLYMGIYQAIYAQGDMSQGFAAICSKTSLLSEFTKCNTLNTKCVGAACCVMHSIRFEVYSERWRGRACTRPRSRASGSHRDTRRMLCCWRRMLCCRRILPDA